MPPPASAGGGGGPSSSSSALGASGRAHALRAVARGRHFLRRRPALAKVAATAVGFAGGDVLTQRFNRRMADGSERAHDFAKTAAMLVVGAALAGPAGLLLYRLCDFAAAAPAAGVSLGQAAVFVVDQAVGCAIWQAAYCAICPWYRDIVAGALGSCSAAVMARRRRRAGGAAAVAAA